ncbi:MAG TPA: twin-arginine translocase TatA/TatE family subunit [Ktedonobacterales bacterium]|nr:twin-arginine translocase TatA/TatE family subunit [Ktedonobacterales bacterium]
MGGFHWWDLAPLLLLALLFFGPKRLPEMGSSIGKTIRAFQHSMREDEHDHNAIENPAASQATPQIAQNATSAQQPAASEPAATVSEESIN